MEVDIKWVVASITISSSLLVFVAATLFVHCRNGRQLHIWQLRSLRAVHILLQVVVVVAFAAWQLSQPIFRYVFWWAVVMMPAWLPVSSFAANELRRLKSDVGAQPGAPADRAASRRVD